MRHMLAYDHQRNRAPSFNVAQGALSSLTLLLDGVDLPKICGHCCGSERLRSIFCAGRRRFIKGELNAVEDWTQAMIDLKVFDVCRMQVMMFREASLGRQEGIYVFPDRCLIPTLCRRTFPPHSHILSNRSSKGTPHV